MIALQTIFVYSFVTLIFYSLCKKASVNNKWGYVVAALLVYTFVFAIRYGVGRDHVSYLLEYEEALKGIYSERTEVGFHWIIHFLASLNCHPIVFFGLVAFLQIFFVFRSFREDIAIFPYMALTFMLGCVWLNFSSALRQVLAFAFFSYSLTFAEKRKWISHYIFIALAVSMHGSAIVLAIIYPLYTLISKFQISNKFIRVGIMIAAVLIGLTTFLADYLELLDRVLFLSGYESYSDGEYQRFLIAEETDSWGIGSFIILAQNIIIVSYLPKLRDFYNSLRVRFLSSFYYIGVVGYYLFAASNIFTRLFGYFHWFQFVLSAYVLYMAKKKNNKKLYYFMLVTYFLIFVGYLYRMFDNSTAFYFYWQSSMFRMPI